MEIELPSKATDGEDTVMLPVDVAPMLVCGLVSDTNPSVTENWEVPTCTLNVDGVTDTTLSITNESTENVMLCGPDRMYTASG